MFYVLLARELSLSPGLIGLLGSMSAIGGLVGSLLADPFARRFGQGPAIWISALAIGPFGFVAPFVHQKMFERHQQIRTKSSFFLANSVQIFALQ